MPKLAANLTMLFNEVDFLDRFAAAADVGLQGRRSTCSRTRIPKEQLAERLAQHKLVQVLHNLPAGDWAQGRARHRLPTGARRRVPGQRRQGDRLRDGAGLPAGELPRGHRAGRRRPRPGARDVRRQPAASPPTKLGGGGHQAADRADQHVRHPGLLSHRGRSRRSTSCATSARPISTCSTTSITCSGWRASSRTRSRRTCRRSRTCSSPTIRAATSPAPARSTIASCSASSTPSATTAGSAASTSRKGNTGRRPRLARRAQRLSNEREGNNGGLSASSGSGIMGAPMAGHLIKGGHRVHLHSRSGVPASAHRSRRSRVRDPRRRSRRKPDIDHHDGPGHAARRGRAVRRRRRRAGPRRRARPSST